MGAKKLRWFSVLTVLATFLAACSSINCPVQNTVATTFALLRADGTPDTLDTDTMWVWTQRHDGTDTLLLNALHGKKATSFSLPVSHTLPEDVLCILIADTTGQYWLDTMRIKKENIPHFESVDCNATYFHEIESASVTQRAFDSIVVNYTKVNYDVSHSHIYLYRKARP